VPNVPGAGAACGLVHESLRDDRELRVLVWLIVRKAANASAAVPPLRLMTMPIAWSITARVVIADRSSEARRRAWANRRALCTATEADDA
jgi:hypothetical protein